MKRWTRPEPHQVLLAAIIAVIAVLAIGPLSSPVVLVLLVVNLILFSSRLLPIDELSERTLLGIAIVTAITSAAQISFSSHGFPALFALFATGSAGYRLPLRPAVAVSVFTGALCTLAAVSPLGPSHEVSPWWIGAVVVLPIGTGMVSRSQRESLRAAQAALAQSDRAAQAEARESILNERARIARDVHDVLAHSLASINLQLELADALLDAGELDRARQATRQAQQIVRQGMEETHRTVFALRESTLPLTETLGTLVAASNAELSITGTARDVAAGPAQTLVRATQESLTNAHKYSPGAPVTVKLGFAEDRLWVQVDNGRPAAGARPMARVGSGMGLVGMRERVLALGGSVTAGPVDSGGWRVRVELPVEAIGGG